MSNILFISGTDTEVGKTLVASLLLVELLKRGVNLSVYKPIETGCILEKGQGCVPVDAELLRETFEKTVERLKLSFALDEVNSYNFEGEVAPSVAARGTGLAIDTDYICETIKERARDCDLVLVEGAGGLLVPIKDDYSFADLAADIDAKVVLVVASKLGALNHAALSFEVMRSRKLNALGYVFNDLFNKTPARVNGNLTATNTNRDELKRIAAQYALPECGFLRFLDENEISTISAEHSAAEELEDCADFLIESFALELKSSV